MDKTPSEPEYTVLINKLYDLIGVVKNTCVVYTIVIL